MGSTADPVKLGCRGPCAQGDSMGAWKVRQMPGADVVMFGGSEHACGDWPQTESDRRLTMIEQWRQLPRSMRMFFVPRAVVAGSRDRAVISVGTSRGCDRWRSR